MKVTKTARFSVWDLPEAEGIFGKYEESKWLSNRMYAASFGARSIDFDDPCMRKAIEPYVAQMRQQRADALSRSAISVKAVQETLTPQLMEEAILQYDTSRYPLREKFVEALFGSERESMNLEQLHREGRQADLGRRKDRLEKQALLAPMTIKSRRAVFQDTYIELVLDFILPSLEAHLPSETSYHFQLLPCIRVVRPGEFSIGVHADVCYGFNPANINFYVALTSIGGTNSIVIEHFQQEDWHVATLKVGDIYRFPGAICGHFTMENTTPTTRVSLDFRVIAGTLFNDSDHYSSSPGYYAKAEKEKEGVGKWVCTGPLPLPDPDARNGFPFTNK